MLTEKYRERLSRWFDQNNYEILRSGVCNSIEIKERDHSWKLDCHIGNDAMLFRLESKYALKYLRQKKVADAVILEMVDPETVKLHIIECKTTIRSGSAKKHTTWEHIKLQFEGALLNALALLGVLGIPAIGDVAFYTAYLYDQVIPKDNPLPSTLKSGVGEGDQNVPFDWLNGRVSILSISRALHRRIQADEGREIAFHLT